jgi:chorismatase
MDRRLVERAVSETYGDERPATTYVYQPPAGGEALAVELWAFTSGSSLRRRGPVSLATAGDVTWSFLGGMETGKDESCYEGTQRVVSEARRELAQADVDFRTIVRTWYYVGGIHEKDAGGLRYDCFNQARNEQYQDCWPDRAESPASTGIGMRTRRVAMETLALRWNGSSCGVTFIDNPLQTRPSEYDISAAPVRKPSFSRGAAIVFPDSLLVIISGTASIRKSVVIFPGDLEAQTRATVENIATLMGGENLKGNYGLPAGATLGDLRCLRVYLKKPEYLPVVREYCRRNLPEMPTTYLVAEVCRPECLLEIEGMAAVRIV